MSNTQSIGAVASRLETLGDFFLHRRPVEGTTGYDFLNDSPTPQDDESHGTAVAGIIGAVGNNRDGVSGVAWKVKLLPVKALNSQGRGPDSAMVKAILYAADSGARIINISSTGTRYSAALDTGTVTVHVRRLREKIEDDPSHPRHLETVWGVGYRFAP